MEIGDLSTRSLGIGQLPRAASTDTTTDFATKLESARPDRSPPVRSDVIPATPPPDVLADVQRAATRAEELHKANRELHFEKDPTTNRIVVQVRDLEGNVLRTIPPSSALDVMSGAGL